MRFARSVRRIPRPAWGVSRKIVVTPARRRNRTSMRLRSGLFARRPMTSTGSLSTVAQYAARSSQLPMCPVIASSPLPRASPACRCSTPSIAT
jgi:hypothetical protein